MIKTASERSGLDIISELLGLTREMAEKLEDSDFLVKSIDKRENLMKEYDRVKTSNPYAASEIEKNKPQIKEMLNEILDLDRNIDRALRKLHTTVKHNLEDSASSQKILNYTNNAISPSGSYMDYKN